MSKRKISLILFFETLFIGILSLVVGICLGFLLSQLMSILVANMFEADLTKFKFFIFWSLSGLLLKIFMSMKKTYYKGLNSFTLRQFSSKINTTVFSMTIICLMLFITICVLFSALSMKNSMSANIRKLAPVDVEIKKDILF